MRMCDRYSGEKIMADCQTLFINKEKNRFWIAVNPVETVICGNTIGINELHIHKSFVSIASERFHLTSCAIGAEFPGI